MANEQLMLKDLIVIHNSEFPTQATEVLESYLEGLSDDKRAKLTNLIENKDYKDKFLEAISYTSFVIFLTLSEVLGGTNDYVAYKKEYLMSVRGDDAETKEMRLYFLNVYSEIEVAKELLGVSDEVGVLFTKEVAELTKKYKKLLGLTE